MRKTSKKIVTTIYLELEQTEALEMLSTWTRVRKSEYIREGINAVLVRYKDIIEKARQETKGGAA